MIDLVGGTYLEVSDETEVDEVKPRCQQLDNIPNNSGLYDNHNGRKASPEPAPKLERCSSKV
jgi:hypothetical protein